MYDIQYSIELYGGIHKESILTFSNSELSNVLICRINT